MAISIDGLITRGDNDSDWVSQTDWDQFDSYIKASDAVIMGRNTMEQFGEDFPIEGTLNVVLSQNKDLHKEDQNLIITSKTPNEVVEMLKNKELEKLLLIGGSVTNKQFIQAGLVDELFLTVEPIVFGLGIKLFSDAVLTKLKLLEVVDLTDQTKVFHYRVEKE